MVDIIGRVLVSRYRVDAFIGRGGMAEVYKVWDKERAVFLAMKLLREDLAEDKIFFRRFRREAQTLAKLQHPNIVRYYGLEQEGPLAFMMMDFIEGVPLRREIFNSEKGLSQSKVLEIFRPVCSALHYAHNSGMVHCDIKPGNILIDQSGRVLLTDFGIARMTDAATATMVGMGTPAYMAPELIQGKEPTPETDIYALGIVLFEMLTGGERPFTGETAKTTGSTSEKVRWEQNHMTAPSPRQHNSTIPSEVEAVVLKCLEKRHDDRYTNPLELLNALESAISGELSNNKIPQGSTIAQGFSASIDYSGETHGQGSQPINPVNKIGHAKNNIIVQICVGLILITMLIGGFTLVSQGQNGVGPLAFLATSTSTSTPTVTPEPSFTPSPTYTNTITPSPTSSPIDTDTPIPTLTPSYTQLSTNTAIPTKKPTKAPTIRPTNKPNPTQSTITITLFSQNCYNDFMILDGKFVVKLPAGKSASFKTTPGTHTLQACGSKTKQNCGNKVSYNWTSSQSNTISAHKSCP